MSALARAGFQSFALFGAGTRLTLQFRGIAISDCQGGPPIESDDSTQLGQTRDPKHTTSRRAPNRRSPRFLQAHGHSRGDFVPAQSGSASHEHSVSTAERVVWRRTNPDARPSSLRPTGNSLPIGSLLQIRVGRRQSMEPSCPTRVEDFCGSTATRLNVNLNTCELAVLGLLGGRTGPSEVPSRVRLSGSPST